MKVETLKEREDKLSQENQDYRSQIALLSDQVLLQDNKTLDLENSIKELKASVNEREDVFLIFFNLKTIIFVFLLVQHKFEKISFGDARKRRTIYSIQGE